MTETTLDTASTRTLGAGYRLMGVVADALNPLEQSGEISMIASYPGLYVSAQGFDPDEKKRNAAKAARIVKDIVAEPIKKDFINGDAKLRISLVHHQLDVLIIASGACTKKIVGTETVEVEKVTSKTVEMVTEERDIVEWDCGGILVNGDDDA